MRVYPDDTGSLTLLPGDYGKDGLGRWWARPPIEAGHAAMLDEHEITEHDDGTISVSPSIVQEEKYHGFLKKGVWSDFVRIKGRSNG
jgi:hypothetical protein